MHSHLRITHGSAHRRKGWRHHDATGGLLRKNDIEHRRDFLGGTPTQRRIYFLE
jgi:hypothetical protein